MNKTFLFIFLVFFTLIGHFAFSNPPFIDRGEDGFVVVLDAGHGGHDPGNLGNGYMEKNIALNIVLKIGEELKKIPGIKVVYTRDDDSFVDLFLRGEIANKAGADLFVS
ncbi:N-acetylmuramoyl-L-alanine amidase family protein, partial [Muriicola sp.]|uniref:N-acetylmuramoyl-L-alanine amidase family protein n=1 Tax=Muriicola sp. TaxID=2020856 RepID=UPI003C7141DE